MTVGISCLFAFYRMEPHPSTGGGSQEDQVLAVIQHRGGWYAKLSQTLLTAVSGDKALLEAVSFHTFVVGLPGAGEGPLKAILWPLAGCVCRVGSGPNSGHVPSKACLVLKQVGAFTPFSSCLAITSSEGGVKSPTSKGGNDRLCQMWKG